MVMGTDRIPYRSLESDWVELEDILTQKRTLWGRIKRVLGKPTSTGVKERLSQFEQRAFNLDLQTEVRPPSNDDVIDVS